MAGAKALLPVGVFGAPEDTMFTTAGRTNPLYFWWPYTVHQDIDVSFPEGWRVERTPQAVDVDAKVFRYEFAAAGSSSLHLTRSFMLNALVLPAGKYDAVKGFFDSVRVADEDQAVISTDAPAHK